MANMSEQICKLITLLAALVALILGVIILTKVNKKGWCGEGFAHSKKMILDATNACAPLITSDLYGNQNEFPCGDWVHAYKNNKKCTTNIGRVDCNTPENGFYAPLQCCDAICDKDLKKLKPGDSCLDPN